MEGLFFIFFFAIAGFILFNFFKTISNQIIEKQKNDQAPILKIPVIVVEKRVQTKTSSRTSSNNRTTHTTYNTFKITFEHIHNQKRHTFSIDESEFDLIVEDDIGYLTYQRKRYHGFVRDYNAKHYNGNQDTNTSINDVQLKIED
jgi:hypothetical protein